MFVLVFFKNVFPPAIFQMSSGCSPGLQRERRLGLLAETLYLNREGLSAVSPEPRDRLIK